MKPPATIALAGLLGIASGSGCGRDTVGGEGREQADAGPPVVKLDAHPAGGDQPRGVGGSPAGTSVSSGSRCPAHAIDGGCVGALYTGQAVGLDIFIMFDQSGSMATKDDGTTMRMDAVRGALQQFLHASGSAGLAVGIGYFGTEPLTCACTSCQADDYAKPAVAMGELPQQSAALLESLAAATPTGETPTGAALRGACSYARQVAAARPGHDLVVLLVTDGEPQAPRTSPKGTCAPTLEDAIAAATECAGGATGLRTFVLGVGPSLEKLNQIAAAGGSGHAYLVEGGGGTEILQALNRIRDDAHIPCALQLPQTTATLNLGTVNLVYADASCSMTTLGMVAGAAACSPQLGGWYYDDPSNARSIRLCEASCQQVSAPGGELRISVGCQTQLIF